MLEVRGIRSREWGERNGVGVAVFYGAVCLRVAIGKEKFLGLFFEDSVNFF